MNFSEQQLNIINSDSKKILVKAGAGTGKTAVIIERIVRLLEADPTLNMNEIAIITFTNKATEELQSRLKNAMYKKWILESDYEKKERFRIQLESLNLAQISTIHMFCKSILEDIGPYFDNELIFSPTFKIGSSRLYETLGTAIEEWVKEKEANSEEIYHLNIIPLYRLDGHLRRLYIEIRSKGLSIEEIIKNTRQSGLFSTTTRERKIKYELADLLEHIKTFHKKYMFENLDADDLLGYCAHILKNRKDINKKIQQKYKHIIVDEFQDTSLHQTEILKSICDDSDLSPNLFVVGDSKQSIYAFRGADLDSYLEVEKWISRQGEIRELQINWRSTPEIVYFTNKVFQNIKDRTGFSFHHEPLIPKLDKDQIKISDAYKWMLGNTEEQSEQIVNFLLDRQKKGEKLSDYAILVRNNYQIERLDKILNKSEINYTILGTGNLFKQEEIIDLYKVLLSILYSNDPVYKIEAGNTIYFNGGTDKLEDIISNINHSMLLYELKPTQFLQFILLSSERYQYFNEDQVANLNKLKEISRKTFSNEHITLLDYVQWYSRKMLVENAEQTSHPNQDENSVVLMTIHRAKGLEFPKVILPYLNEGVSRNALEPTLVINPETKSIEYKFKNHNSIHMSNDYQVAAKQSESEIYSEELRVLYVALTRAKEKLILLGNKNKGSERCFQNWLLDE